MSKIACENVIDEILKKPNIRIGFATGQTPLLMYKELTNAYRKNKISFSGITSFNLDEYYPISRKNKNSYYDYMQKNLFKKINIKKSNINSLNGEAKNPEKECKNYERKIKKKKINLQILGVGVNGHIGFNEPGSSFNSKTRLVKLAEQTIERNSRFFKNKKEVPEHALTMGIRTIMNCDKIIFLASGKNKANVVKALVEGRINKNCPASFLKKHKNLVLIIDKQAGRFLKKSI